MFISCWTARSYLCLAGVHFLLNGKKRYGAYKTNKTWNPICAVLNIPCGIFAKCVLNLRESFQGVPPWISLKSTPFYLRMNGVGISYIENETSKGVTTFGLWVLVVWWRFTAMARQTVTIIHCRDRRPRRSVRTNNLIKTPQDRYHKKVTYVRRCSFLAKRQEVNQRSVPTAHIVLNNRKFN